YNSGLAMSCNNAGAFYNNQGQSDKAEEYYLKSIGIYEKLASENPDRYEPDLAAIYFNYAIFRKSDDMFEKALALAKTQPDHPMCKEIIAALE
ncbi:MAG: tetratricopeptide repeat protein, partial [Clostridia bacterium]|nr:tetratricopeptide repeat protein [Clostridia bacterium]